MFLIYCPNQNLLLKLTGLSNREAQRKLHDSVNSDSRHLPSVIAYAKKAGKYLNVVAIQKAHHLRSILQAVLSPAQIKTRRRNKDLCR